MAEVLPFCFLTIFRMPLSACLRRSGAVLDGSGYPPPPPPPAGCVTIGAPALRGLTSIFCSPISSSPKRRKFWFWTDPWRHRWPQSQILTLIGEFTSAELSNSVWNLEIGQVVWKISGGPLPPPSGRVAIQPPSWRGLKAAVSFHDFAKKKIALISTMKPVTHAYQSTIYFYWDSVSALVTPRLHMYSTRQKYSAFWSPPLVFLRYLLNKWKYQRQTFSTLSRMHFTHYVFFSIPGYDRSATNNVRVTSCSVDFNTATDAVFKLRSIGL